MDVRKQLLRHVMHGEAVSLEALLDAGLDPAMLDPDGRTLLHLLPWLFPGDARLRVLDRLLAAGLDVDARDRHGRTPLHLAVRRGGSRSLVLALLAAGADPAAENAECRVPLDLAPAARHDETARLLGA